APAGAALGDLPHRAHPAPAAAFGGHAVVGAVASLLSLQRRGKRGAPPRPVLAVHQLEQVGVAIDGPPPLQAEDRPPAAAEVDLVGSEVVVPLGEVAAAQGELEALLRQGERAFRAALLRHVAPDAAVAEEFAAGAQARLARNDVDLARAALVGARDLQVEERLLRA